MTTLNELRSQADEIASAGHAGWGNTMRDAADEIDRLRTEAVAADIRIANDAAVIAGLTAERDEFMPFLKEVDLSPKPYFQVCWAHGWAGDYESEEEAREECLSLCGHGRSIREIKPGDDGYKNPRQPQLTEKRFLLAAAGAASVPEDWRSAVAMAYGHLWHINNEPMAPIPLRSEESASYAARKLLRDLLTTEERGEAINSVRAMLPAAPKEPT